MIKISFNSLKSIDKPIDKKESYKLILKSKFSNDERISQESKISLFKMMSKITVKNINNFFHMMKGYEGEIIFNKDDLVNESYIVFNKCVLKFNHKEEKYKYNFHWWYNKSLMLGMMRIIEKNYKCRKFAYLSQHRGILDKLDVEINLNFVPYYLDVIKLTEQEKLVIQSRIEQKRMGVFLKENKNISEQNYIEIFNSVKEKFKKHFHEEQHSSNRINF